MQFFKEFAPMNTNQKPQTLCQKVQEEIRKMIAVSAGAENERLPSERVLAEKMGVSRITARNAYQALVNRGLLRPGKRGYRIRKNAYEGVLTLDGFTRGVGEQEEVRTKILGVETIKPEREIMIALGCGLHDEILRIRRLRLIGGRPCQLEWCHLVRGKFPDITENRHMQSIYRTFETKYDTRIVRAEQILSVIKAESEVLELLKFEPGEKVLFLKRTSFDQRDNPVEYVHLYLNPQNREFYMELKR